MKWARKPKLVFVWMVAISLFGEFAGDAGVYVFSGRLQFIADTELTQLKNENLKLQEQVGDAAKAAVTAQRAADGALADFKQVDGRIGTLNKGLDNAQKTATLLFATMNNAELDLSARNITDTPALAKEFSKFKGTTIAFGSYFEPEGYKVCADLLTIARNAGVNIVGLCGKLPEYATEPPTTGVVIFSRNPDATFPLVREIGRQLRYNVGEGNAKNEPENPLIFVGWKYPLAMGFVPPTNPTLNVQPSTNNAPRTHSK
jgi:hypothetical protein